MELHDHLHALGLSRGREVFGDADGLRPALDDVGEATARDRDLLVDAVRYGAPRLLTALLDDGAAVPAAVEEVGDRLLRERGGFDVAGTRWAVAALGFALGRVGESDVHRYRPRREEVSWTTPQPPPRRGRRWPVLVAVAAVLALVAGLLLLVVRDDDGEPSAGRSGSAQIRESDDPDEPGEPVDPDGTDAAAVDVRYAGLADRITSGADSCEADDAGGDRAGRSERLACEVTDVGTLELVTYRSEATLEARRQRELTDAAGGVRLEARRGTVMAFEKEDAGGRATAATLYWDADSSRQSATYTADPGVDLDELVTAFRATAPSLAYPEGPTSPALIDFAGRRVPVETCTRIETAVAHELEESFCDVDGPVEVYLGRFATADDLRAYRELTLANAKQDDRGLRTWRRAEGGPPAGDAYEYLTDDGVAVRYWDRADCRCYAEAYLSGGSFESLQEWWAGG